MKPSRRIKLEEIALERLERTANDVNQPWSYAFWADDSQLFGLCRWDAYDYGGPADFGWTPEGWSMQRRQQLVSGEAASTKAELREWRLEICRWKACTQPEMWAQINPMRMENGQIGAFEVWVDRGEGRYLSGDPPDLFGVFNSFDEAKATLLNEWAMGDGRRP